MASLVDLIRDNFGRFPAWVVYAFLECFLIILLFLDGFISFFSQGFARFFGLKVPCLFCTKIDHLFTRHDPDLYYQDNICDSHALEVSFLAYCHVHRRLANVSRMCKGCLLSFAITDNRTTSDTYRNLVDILGADFDDDHLKIQHRPRAGTAGAHTCSCCGEQLRIKSSFVPGLLRMLSGTGDGPETPTTMPSTMAVDGEASGFHPFAQVRYQGLRLTSDTESEVAEVAEEEDESSSAVPSETDDATGPTKMKRCAVILDKTASDGCDEQVCLLQPSDSADRGGGRGPMVSGLKETGYPGLGSGELNRPNDLSLGQLSGFAGSGLRDNFNNAEASTFDPSDVNLTISVNRGAIRIRGKPLQDAPRVSATPSPRLSMLRKRLSMKRNDIGTESFKGGKTDGECLLHRLKRQVRLDRKTLLGMCAELEQERSASTVAANQAMAMITRLQEEKAAVQMNALQYQRMMEEQAEYDQEALQVLKKLLSKRQRVIKALEAEVGAFRERYPGENLKFVDGFGSESEDDIDQYIDGDSEIGGDDDRFKIRSRSSSFSNKRFESQSNDKGE
ncbi:probable myosin-binding protein 5 [Aristolochia californica]|uniref:probable myosin-binding protein 5 n=1 Tax=Aristolochia californica TaxID=171875 RepID=UPI0035E22DB1